MSMNPLATLLKVGSVCMNGELVWCTASECMRGDQTAHSDLKNGECRPKIRSTHAEVRQSGQVTGTNHEADVYDDSASKHLFIGKMDC